MKMYPVPPQYGAGANLESTSFSSSYAQMTSTSPGGGQQRPQLQTGDNVYSQWSGPSSPPSQFLGTYGSGSISTLQIRVVDDYRVQPPIAVPSSLMPSHGTTQSIPLDMTLERQLVESVGKSHAQTFFESAEPGSILDSQMQQYLAMGFSRAQVALGLAYTRQANGKDAETVEFANSYRELTSMGYNPALAVGALMKSGNDLPAATETCLNISS